jgi:MFS family permease
MISKEEIGHLWPFYFYKFMRGVVFLTTITLFIFLTEKGLTYTQGAMLVAFSSLAIFISELVTGSIADTFGRKRSVVISLLIDSAIILGVAVTNSFWPLVVLFSLWGVSTTLASGADSAWAIDSLIQKKREDLLDSYYSKGRSFFNVGMIVAGLLSTSILAFSGNQTLWFLRVFLTLTIAIVLGLFAKEKFVSKDQVSSISVTLSNAKKALKIFKKSLVLKRMGFALFFIFLATYIAESVAIQDFKLQAGIPLEWWGILFVIVSVTGIFTPQLGLKIANKFKKLSNYLTLSYFLMAILYALAIVSLNPYYVAILTMLFIVIYDFYLPAEDKLYNKHTPSAQRASVNSIRSMIQHGGVILGMLIAGFLTDYFGGAKTIAISSLVLIPAIILVFGIKEKKSPRYVR